MACGDCDGGKEAAVRRVGFVVALVGWGALFFGSLVGAACEIGSFTVNESGASEITAVAGLHYYLEVMADAPSGDCCSALKWGVGDLGSLPCIDKDDVCPSHGALWSAWKDVPSTPGTYTINVGLYGADDCAGEPFDTRSRTLIVVEGDVDVTLEVSATSACESGCVVFRV